MAYFRALVSDVGLPDVTKAMVWIDCIDGSKLEPLMLKGADLERLYDVLGRLKYIAAEQRRPLILIGG